MPINRRTFLKRTAAASGIIAASPLLRYSNLLASPDEANPLRRIPDLEGNLLTVAPTRFSLRPGGDSAIYGINGSYLGPTIRLNRGGELNVKMENRLIDEDLIIHWHGILAPSEMDGHPHLAVGPGEDYDYNFTVNQRAGTYWYHSHTDKFTGSQVYRGVAGLFIVHDEEESGLGLPSGDYDISVVLQDKRVTPDFELDYNLAPVDVMRGWQGDTMLVNGRPNVQLDVDRTLYRFRLLNGSNARVFLVGFEDGRTFHLIANEGGLLESPVEIDQFFLPPAGRAEILVDFSDDELNANLLLRSLTFFNESFPGSRQGKEADLLCFRVTGDGDSGGVVPQTMTTIEPYDPEAAMRSRSFRLHMANGHHAINDLSFELNRIDFEVPMGELEVWEFFNPTQLIHPMHVHGTQFQILDRNGRTENIRPEEKGWKDMALLFPQEQVRVLVRFDAHPGRFMLHCHNLEHEDDGMMLNFRVNNPASVGGGVGERGHLSASPNIVEKETLIRFNPVKGDRQLQVIDLQGRTLLQRIIPSGRDSSLLDLSGFPSGSYWCRLGNESVRLLVK
ncbi:MAG: multicopper oxidase domain-containing protein [Ignavibacteriae bacterium]|nr:multicopper oxidase domain-containing protein [Ignavibacteriota bacterium]MCB9214264.1 multicopper oxidase domain-containing protein [Ignavibacteria bacterium]